VNSVQNSRPIVLLNPSAPKRWHVKTKWSSNGQDQVNTK
jgi:hypothetical protein